MTKVILNSDHMFAEETRPKFFCIVYSCWQSCYDEILMRKGEDRCHFMQSLPDRTMLEQFPKPWALIIDDNSGLAFSSKFCLEVYTTFCHHLNGLAFILTQNPFQKSNGIARTISLNSAVLVFMRNREADQIKRIGRSIFGSNWKVLYEAYNYLLQKYKYPYVICDTSALCPNSMKIRSHVFDDQLTTCFLPRNGSQL